MALGFVLSGPTRYRNQKKSESHNPTVQQSALHVFIPYSLFFHVVRIVISNRSTHGFPLLLHFIIEQKPPILKQEFTESKKRNFLLRKSLDSHFFSSDILSTSVSGKEPIPKNNGRPKDEIMSFPASFLRAVKKKRREAKREKIAESVFLQFSLRIFNLAEPAGQAPGKQGANLGLNDVFF